MKRTSMIVLVLAALTLGLSGLAWAADPPASQTQSTPAPSTSASEQPSATSKIEKMEYPSAPPEELKKLSMFVGNWTAKQHMFESPMGPESNSAGKSGYKWSFDGMHLEGTHQVQMGGKAVTGRSTWGWDPDRKQYQIVWTDNLAPVSYVYYGTFAQDNMMVLFTTSMMQGKAITEKMTFSFTDPDNFGMFMENDMSGEMKKVMEETAARVKPAAAKPKTKSSTTTKSTSTTTKKPATTTTTKK
jgi:hypothetical protein